MNIRYPFIVLEGIDYTGKSTFLQSLESFENMVIFDGIPAWKEQKARGIKPYTDDEGRFAYFKKLNEEFGRDIVHTLKEKPVLLARYALSTIGGHNVLLGERTEDQFKHILNPDITFLLTIKEDELKRRMENRMPEHQYESDAKVLLEMQDEMKRVISNQEYQHLYGRATIIESKRGPIDKELNIIKQEINRVLMAYK